jgi:hypothetical protein
MRLPWLFLVLTVLAAPTWAIDGPPSDPDTRINLGLTPEERAEFLAEMRQMLTSIQGIIAGLGSGDRARVVEAARYSGNRMARATPDAVRSRLPPGFKDIGGPTHMMFEELVIRAETDDTETLLSYTGAILQQCLACHALFRAH